MFLGRTILSVHGFWPVASAAHSNTTAVALQQFRMIQLVACMASWNDITFDILTYMAAAQEATWLSCSSFFPADFEYLAECVTIGPVHSKSI